MSCDLCDSGPLANYYSAYDAQLCPDCYAEQRQEDDLRAAIFRAEADLEEARKAGRRLLAHLRAFIGVHVQRYLDEYPWLTD